MRLIEVGTGLLLRRRERPWGSNEQDRKRVKLEAAGGRQVFEEDGVGLGGQSHPSSKIRRAR